MADFPYEKTVIYFRGRAPPPNIFFFRKKNYFHLRDIKTHQKNFEPLFFGQKMYKWPALIYIYICISVVILYKATQHTVVTSGNELIYVTSMIWLSDRYMSPLHSVAGLLSRSRDCQPLFFECTKLRPPVDPLATP